MPHHKGHKMKTTYTLISLLTMLTPILHAQHKAFPASELSIGPEYAIPIGAFRESKPAYDIIDLGYNYGIGGSVKYLLRLNEYYGLSLLTGLVRYHPKTSPLGGAPGFTAIPVQVGANFRYRSLFAEPQFGFTYFSNKQIFYQSGSTTYGLTAGAYITKQISLSANYERWNKGGFAASHLGIGIAYTFSLKGLNSIDSIMKERAAIVHRLRPEYDKTSEAWRKQKTFKALGWVSLGVGVPLTFLGLVTAIASEEGESIRPGTPAWLIGSGAVISSASIPFFILSHKYKKKAIK